MSRSYPVGGTLMHNLINTLFNNIEDEDNAYMKSMLLKEIMEGSWREGLSSSLVLADRMLDDLYVSLKSGLHGYDAVVDLRFVLDSPGLTGSASGLFKSLFEVGLSMDWVLGLPYYPGSTLKGVIRSELEALFDSKEVSSILGDAGRLMSRFTVYDSYPVGCEENGRHPCLVLTGGVVTPHYYESGNAVSSEAEASPTPVQHVVIAPGTVFRVVMGVRCPLKVEDSKTSIDIETARKVASSVLGRNSVDCGSNGDGGCSCVSEYALSLAMLLASGVGKGFAARSAKGYNVLRPYSGNVTRNIASLSLYIQPPANRGHRKTGGRKNHRHRDNRYRSGSGRRGSHGNRGRW